MLTYKQAGNYESPALPVASAVDQTIEDSREEISEVTTGSPLNVHDILFCNAAERRRQLNILGDIYSISFTNDIQPAPGSISFTSLKCVVTAENGKLYFLKQKAGYCSTEQQLRKSSLLQHVTSTQLHCVPRIIHTTGSNPHAAIGRRTFLLTPFVEGQFFLGKQSQSVSCGDALGLIHSIGMRIDNIESTELNSHDETKVWISRLAQIATTDNAAKQEVIRQMGEIADCNEIQNIGRKGWLHGDFAPYNMVFDHSDSVIAVNDFDNVAYGPLSRDVAECILTHCGIMYAGPSSSLRAPICTRLDVERGKMMLERYLQSSGLQPSDLCELRQQFSLIWLELLSLGIVRGDFSFKDVQNALDEYSSMKNRIDIISQA